MTNNGGSNTNAVFFFPRFKYKGLQQIVRQIVHKASGRLYIAQAGKDKL